MSIIYSEYVSVDLGIQNVQRMRRIVLSTVAYNALPNFSILSQKRRDFKKKVTEHKICFDFLYDFCLKRVSF